MPRRKVLSGPELNAYKDGWDAAPSGQEQHERRAIYKDQRDRAAFDEGWADCIKQIDMGNVIPCQLVVFPASSD